MSIAELSSTSETDDVVVLHWISWEHYLALRKMRRNRHVHMTYDRGELQIMSPSRRQERLVVLLGMLIDVWAEEKNIPMQSCRTMTILRKALKRGFEPDNCYYVQNEPRVFGKAKLNFAVDPPPDLAIEVELRSGASKVAIYQSFGVPELWRVLEGQIHVLILSEQHVYFPQASSVCFPGFPLEKAVEVLRQMDSVGQTKLVRSFRAWVRSNCGEAI